MSANCQLADCDVTDVEMDRICIFEFVYARYVGRLINNLSFLLNVLLVTIIDHLNYKPIAKYV